MQRSARKSWYGILGLDLLLIVVTLVLASGLRDGFRSLPGRMMDGSSYVPILLSSIVGWAAIYGRMKLDGFNRGWNWAKVASEVAVGVAVLMVFVSATAYVTHDYFPRLLLALFAGLLTPGLIAIRTMAHLTSESNRCKPVRKVVIVGNGRVAWELLRKLEGHPEMRCEIVGFLYPSAMEPSSALGISELDGVSVPALDALDFVRQKGATDIIIVFSGQEVPHGLLDLVRRCRPAGIRVSLVPHAYELYTSRTSLLDIDGLPVVCLDDTGPDWQAQVFKRALDLTLTVTLLPAVLAIVAVASAYLRRHRRQAFRTELRIGKDGNAFVLWRMNVERHETGLSRFERLLASLSLTELPQLWNVIRGDMSMVGPRPETPERVKHYSEWQKQRLTVMPGLTGLAQVRGLREQSSSEEKAHFDLQYIASWSVSSDVVLLVQTFWTLLLRLVCSHDGENGSSKPGMASYAGLIHVDSAQSSAD